MRVSGAMLRVFEPGMFSTIQDLGRPGWFHAGVGISGAVDRGALTLANRLVGNEESAAGIECVLGRLVLVATGPAVLAVTGAPAPITVDGRPEGRGSVLFLEAGQRLELGVAPVGLRCYVAVRGGIDIAPVLGSRSRDTLAGLGPEPLRAGAELPIGAPPRRWPELELAPLPAMSDEPVTVRVRLGPRDDWFDNPTDLFVGGWQVSSDSDRIGVRLDRAGDAPALRRTGSEELATEGMPLGAIQVPPSGQPVVFLADHPITGGYPVVGTVIDADVDALAQARPGQRVRFLPWRP
ncbi:biotin-dependent carboxyltransferase family protein [Nocardia sp. CDC159]|uniref:Biotin-dependent carboxyltransferase family protein n=1 Tax=Nocardia pulmonis TaxID=2951408 RepID=A0A9X2EC56_9NOCA|nr:MULTISPECIES: biotin-dependent carboxyltransferase family protein [Nocardia]MCM6775498.1 biotin-dependent carboxyltransferase family protein [Nocardia pulmonis]MCM6787768.1 biotin-dependent carboxyltransferase family protein [Nocardia sp. CDC159]